MAATMAHRPRFGIQLQAQRATWTEYLTAIQMVEELGYDTLWTFDHMLPYAGPDDGPCFETWTTLAAMAMATSRVRIGALVNGVLYRDPATLAKSAVMVDQISGGRLEFALGASWGEREFRAYGLPFPPIGERLGRLDEALVIVKALWTQHRTTFQGRYYSIEDAPCEPKPAQHPYPPIMVGGSGKTTLRIAAKHATMWNGVGSPEKIIAPLQALREACAAIGRDPATIELSAHFSLVIARTHAEAEERAKAFARSLDQRVEDAPDFWLIGTPEEMREQIQRYIDIGVTHWIMAVGAPFDREMLALFAKEVIPAFRVSTHER